MTEKLPGWLEHLSFFILYAFFLSLMFLARDKQETIPQADPHLFLKRKRGSKTLWLYVCL